MTHQTRRRFPWLCLLMLSWMTAEVQAAAVTDPQIGLNFIRFSWVSRRGAMGPATTLARPALAQMRSCSPVPEPMPTPPTQTPSMMIGRPPGRLIRLPWVATARRMSGPSAISPVGAR